MKHSLQQPKLRPCAFGTGYANLFKVHEDGDLMEAMQLAADLAEGISQLCGRLDEAINNDGVAYCAEVRALGFLGNVVETLVRSSIYGLKLSLKAGGE
ncbi:hypothetical protein [Pseudomonas sp. BF-B-30]|uniref:hypothetical protein n=1 Tax=Pseudomonas sp. BF-B-30 TaxID=2832388 RepID=UPI001CBD81AB|nr:hypothetical protein [Pseudomonas sp. BF-B-30]